MADGYLESLKNVWEEIFVPKTIDILEDENFLKKIDGVAKETILDEKRLRQDFMQIEEWWYDAFRGIIKQNSDSDVKLSWLFFGEYTPFNKTGTNFKPTNYIYSPGHSNFEKTHKLHISEKILVFDLIPFTVKYGNRDKEKYETLLKWCKPYWYHKWDLVKQHISETTRIGYPFKFQLNLLKESINFREFFKKFLIDREIGKWEYGGSLGLDERIDIIFKINK